MDDTSLSTTDMTATETSSQGPHPLLIPEILLQIAPMLTQPTILLCVRVCKTWHECLMPFLFQRINLPRKNQIRRSKLAARPLISTLTRNAHNIRTLICADSNTILRRITPQCTGVETLVLGNITLEILPILRLCKDTLVKLELMPNRQLAYRLHSRMPQKYYNEILNAILGLVKLRHLVLDYLGIRNGEQLDSFLQFCTQLTSLEIHHNAILEEASTTTVTTATFTTTTTITTTSPILFYNMRSLSLVDSSMSQADQLVWQRRCPSLEHITWIQRNHIMQMEQFGLLWNEQGRELKSLDISCGVTHDQQLSVIFTQLPFLEKLVAQDSGFGPISLTALLTSLRDKIQVLDLAGCKAVTPEMVNLIMESCPSLKSLSADRLRAADSDDSGSGGGSGIMEESHKNRWVCHDLEELRIVFTGPTLSPPNEAQFATYSKIATLRKLRVLNLGRYTSSTPPPKSILDLSLAGGFRQLASLTELRVFDFCDLDHKMTMEEFKFMLKAWPKLETIHGKLSSGGTRASFIESYLKNKRPWLRVKSSMGFNRRATRTEY